MKRITWLAWFALWLVSCRAPTVPPQPTYTPLPTYTPYPTFTPPAALPTAAPTIKATPAPAANCIAWTEAAAHMNETTCVRGLVSSTYQDQRSGTFFIDFDDTRTSFYGVSFKYTWDDLRGKCVELYGTISPYRGRPQIIIDRKEQVRECP